MHEQEVKMFFPSEGKQLMFTKEAKLTALSIVSVFETSRPLGDHGACVVLNDGAGVSYGICQFTHRSGSLRQVVERYLALGGDVGRATLEVALPYLMKHTHFAVRRLAASEQFRKALVAASATPEMKEAQEFVAFQRYLRPAIDLCERRGFVMPLSLAVIYDSVVHGSLERISVRVMPFSVNATASKDATLTEKAWITAYIRERHRWLASVPRLNVTTYRTRFFLDQIAVGNWELKLPVVVHGVRLTSGILGRASEPHTRPDPLSERSSTAVVGADSVAVKDRRLNENAEEPHTRPDPLSERSSTAVVGADDMAVKDRRLNENVDESARVSMSSAAERFDQVDNAITAVTTRTDRAKSLWTTIGGSVSQAAWAIFGWVAGVPREVWIAVAVIAGLLMLLYLYRQIVLGRLREAKEVWIDNGAKAAGSTDRAVRAGSTVQQPSTNKA